MPMLDGFMPCPFCGGRDTAALAQMPFRKGWLTVQCARCEASGPWRTEELAAVAAWNSRADVAGVEVSLSKTASPANTDGSKLDGNEPVQHSV